LAVALFMVGYDLGASSSEDIYKTTTKKHADSDALEPKADVVHGDRLRVPVRASTEDGQTVGDGICEIGPDDPGYDSWLAWIQEHGDPNAR
jgi:hypothetical protein